MDDRPVVVTGATGNVGLPVVRLLTASGVAVRAAVRTPGHRGAPDPLPEQTERVVFDWLDPGTWAPAFAGARAVLVVRPPQLSRPRTQMVPALQAAREAGVEHMVLLSLQGAEGNRLVPHAVLEHGCGPKVCRGPSCVPPSSCRT